MPRVRPTEIRKVAQLLDSEAEDVESLARGVLELVNEMWNGRDKYVVAAYEPGFPLAIYGVYDTAKQAERAIGKDIIASREGARGGVIKVVTPGASD